MMRSFAVILTVAMAGLLCAGMGADQPATQGETKVATTRNGDDETAPAADPTQCAYAPPGEYTKDHTLVFHDGWWRFFSISGTRGYYLGYTGNEETFSYSISRDLVNWEFRGHVLHASQYEGFFDRDQVWAPFCLKTDKGFYLYYSGIVHPGRRQEYRRLGHKHPTGFGGHVETQGVAFSPDLVRWTKACDPHKGLGVPGRDSHVVRDEANSRWLLYSTGKVVKDSHSEEYVSQSQDLLNWKFIGVCVKFPQNPAHPWGCTTESMTVMKHPLSGKWIAMGNMHYVLSDDPTNFLAGPVRRYALTYEGKPIHAGGVGEMIQWKGKWYRSGCFGPWDYWKLSFTEIEWVPDGAFKVVKPSVMVLDEAKPAAGE